MDDALEGERPDKDRHHAIHLPNDEVRRPQPEDEALVGVAVVLADAQVEIPVQVMGRVRSHVTVAADADAPALERAALGDAKVQAHIAGKMIRRVIVVPGKLVNIVIG